MPRSGWRNSACPMRVAWLLAQHGVAQQLFDLPVGRSPAQQRGKSHSLSANRHVRTWPSAVRRCGRSCRRTGSTPSRRSPHAAASVAIAPRTRGRARVVALGGLEREHRRRWRARFVPLTSFSRSHFCWKSGGIHSMKRSSRLPRAPSARAHRFVLVEAAHEHGVDLDRREAAAFAAAMPASTSASLSARDRHEAVAVERVEAHVEPVEPGFAQLAASSRSAMPFVVMFRSSDGLSRAACARASRALAHGRLAAREPPPTPHSIATRARCA